MNYSMSESEVVYRFYAVTKGMMITRALANSHLQEIMSRSKEGSRADNRSFRSLVSKFALRMKACYFIR